MKKIYLVSVSGGKDSQASWIWMKNNYPRSNIRAYSCDTGWEHEETYKHLDYLEDTLGRIDRISSEKYDGFEDMCIKRKGFPTRIGRFCTVELKIKTSESYIRKWIDAGYKVINVVGVRADESRNRSGEGKWKCTFLGDIPKYRKYKRKIKPPSKNSLKKYYKKENAIVTYQPIVHWEERQVYEYNIKNNTKNNPLYTKGFTRVGCIPCIMARVGEIGLLEAKYIDRIDKLEKNVAKVSNLKEKPTFFQDKVDGKTKKISTGITKNTRLILLDLIWVA